MGARKCFSSLKRLVICLRIGWALERPHTEFARQLWLSPGDLERLVVAALLSNVRFGIYYGVSNNTRSHWSIENARADLGYHPLDNSEMFSTSTEPSGCRAEPRP